MVGRASPTSAETRALVRGTCAAIPSRRSGHRSAERTKGTAMKPNSLPIPTNRLLLACLLVGGAACQSPATSQPQQPPQSKPAAPIGAPVEPAPPIVIAPPPIAI